MDRKPPIPSSSVTFGGFEAKGEKIFLKFYLMNDYRNVGEFSYEIQSGPKTQARRLERTHAQIERCLQELLHVNAAMLQAAQRDAAVTVDKDE